jgi:chaperone modulatory protein CbpM
MILKRTEFMARTNIDEQTLETWLSEQWLVPVEEASDEAFTDADIARAQLIRELNHDLGVNQAGISVALHLLDQLHGLRRAVYELRQIKPRG